MSYVGFIIEKLSKFSFVVLEEFCRILKSLGWGTFASSLSKVTLNLFANWRWGTLHDILHRLEDILATLCVRWVDFPAKSNRDTIRMQEVKGALQDEAFLGQFEFVSWFCRWLIPVSR